MIVIRLSRHGRKNRPSFRVVVQEKQRAPSSNVLETLGHYNPLTHPATFEVKADRVKHWMDHGAQLSNTLHNLLIDKKIISGDKRRIVNLNVGAKKEEGEASKPADAPAPAASTEAPAEAPKS